MKVYNLDKILVNVLCGVDLDIVVGEFMVIVGLLGLGKIMFLNIIGGLDWFFGGMVSVGDMEINDLFDNQLIDFWKDNIGFVFQVYNFILVFMVQENVEFVMLL